MIVKGVDASIAIDTNGNVHISARNEEGVGTRDEGGKGRFRYITNMTGGLRGIPKTNINYVYLAPNKEVEYILASHENGYCNIFNCRAYWNLAAYININKREV